MKKKLLKEENGIRYFSNGDWIDLSNMPRKTGKAMHKHKLVIDWEKVNGISCDFLYGGEKHKLKILNINKTKENNFYRYYLDIEINNNTYTLEKDYLKEMRFSKIFNKISSDFRFSVGNTFKNKSNEEYITITDCFMKKDKRDNNMKYYKYICSCGYSDGEISEYSLIKGSDCLCCSGKITIKDINSIWKTHNHLVKYFFNKTDAEKYSKGSNKNILFICPNCGLKKRMYINNFTKYGFSCPRCSDGISYPNKFIYSLLDELKIRYTKEYSPEWAIDSKGIRRYYDVKLEQEGLNNIIIEMDGGLGHGKNIHGKNNMSKEETLEIDKEKDNMAKKHGINVIRINCDYKSDINNRFDFIKNNTILKLSNVIDLTNIDWNSIRINANKNIMLEACRIKKENNELSAIDISKILGISQPSVINYLNEGTKIGLCNYIGKECNVQPVEVFRNKDNISIGVFESISDLIRLSKALYGRPFMKKEILKILNKNIQNDELGIKIKRITYQEYINKKDLNYPSHTIYYKCIKAYSSEECIGVFKTKIDIERYIREKFKEIILTRNITNSMKENKPYREYTFEYVYLTYDEYIKLNNQSA